MLSAKDNELLTHVGPGTVMGDFLRQYWIPAVRSDELPAPDCPPVRIRLLGENLIAFRATSGRIGLIQNNCPHRGASLFFGRNEEDGLRCVYHGWKFDCAGQCVDMPSEPPESVFKTKVRATAYPCEERNGIIWTYMGPREVPPPLPMLEANMLAEGEYQLYTIFQENNFMQGWEGEMDTVHQAFLHSGMLRADQTTQGNYDYYITRNRSAKFSVTETEFGTSYGAYRPAEGDQFYWRIAHQLFPFYAMIPTGTLGIEVRFRAYVPIDDHHTMMWTVTSMASADRNPRDLHYLPNTTDWYGRWRIEQSLDNDFRIDREEQRTATYSGIEGIRQQDMAMTGSMGPIMDRTNEHLGTTDQLIIRTRRKLIADARALRESGTVPAGVDHPELYATRSGGCFIAKGTDWIEGTANLRKAFVEHPELVRIAGG